MVKLDNFARSIGKNLASLVVGAGIALGALDAKSEELIPVSVTNLAPFVSSRTAHCVCNDVKFNGRVSQNKIVLLYDYYNSSTYRIIGGLTINPNTTNTIFSESYLQGKKTIPPIPGLSFPEVATNDLNGASEWFGTIDLNNNGTSLFQGVETGKLYVEEGECISKGQVSFTGMSAFPADKTSTVTIDGIRINGYEDNGLPNNPRTNGIPDIFEFESGLPMNTTTTNTDFDADGHTDYNEWVAGTDPTDSNSCFSVKSFYNGTNTFALNIGNTLEGRLYDVAASTNLADSASWTNKVSDYAGNGTNTLYIEKDFANKQEFYKPSVKLSPDEVVNP